MCRLCQTKPVYEFTNKRKVCRNCFIKWFEKKVLYTIRKFGMLKKGEVVAYKKAKGFREVVLEEILNMIGKKGFVKITSKKKYDRLAIPITTDLMAYEIINELINEDIIDFKISNKKQIAPLFLFTDKEVELYAKLKKLIDKSAPVPKRFSAYSRSQIDKDLINVKNNRVQRGKIDLEKISNFIDNLELKHPEVKRAVVKGILGLN